MTKHDTEKAMETQAKHPSSHGPKKPKPKPKPKPKAEVEAPKAEPMHRTRQATDAMLEERRLALRKRTRASLKQQRDRNTKTRRSHRRAA